MSNNHFAVVGRRKNQVQPDPARSRIYQDYYAIYRRMYATLKSTYEAVAQVEAR